MEGMKKAKILDIARPELYNYVESYYDGATKKYKEVTKT